MKPKHLLPLVLLAGQIILLTGCATSTLWETGQFANYHEPANPANVRLFQTTNSADLLVEYDEARESDERIQRRAYWLEHNFARVRSRRKPQFVSPSQYHALSPIPVANSAVSPEPASIYAILATNDQSFVLPTINQEKGPYQLPVYTDATGRTKQVLLTPLTVAADFTIIGGYLFMEAWSCGALSWLH